MSNSLGYAALAAASGLLIPIMARMNGTLAQATGTVAWPALIVCCGALAGGVGFALVARSAPPANLFDQPLPFYFAGLVMAFYIIAITWLVPRFGVGPSIMCVVSAQIVAAVAIDQFGLLGAPVRPLDLPRAIGVALLIVGVLLAARAPAAPPS